MNFQNGRKIFTSLTFGCPNYESGVLIHSIRASFH